MQRVRISGATLGVVDRGEGPILLLVHGFPLDHSMWSHQIKEFATAYRVIAPDLRGFGQSDGADRPLSMTQHADDLAELLAELAGDEPVTFCGLSMGGYIAWPFVQRHRQRLTSLILCDTRAAADTEPVARGRRYLAERVLRDGTREVGEEMLQKLLSQHSRSAQPQLVQQLLQVLTSTAPETVAAALLGMADRPDMTSLLPKLDCPTLVLCGEADQITPPTEMRAMAEKIPRSVYRPIADAGHMAPAERPEIVNRVIHEFLSDLDPR